MRAENGAIGKWFPFIVVAMMVSIVLSILLSISIGQVGVPFVDTYRIALHKMFGLSSGAASGASSSTNIVWLLRFPRALMACLVGMGLSVCGVIMQASVQNPLADPYILGVSSGATLGATFSILIGFGSIPLLSQAGVSLGAFAGALLASVLVLTFANIGGRVTSSKLVLSGVVVDSMFSAFSSIIVYFANNADGLKSITFWIMGSLASAKWENLSGLAMVVLASVLFFLTQSRTLNTMLMGDETATTLGINLSFYRKLYLAIASLITGVLVANCGMIGFVGLIIPHITRALVGSDHKKMLPLAVLIGGLFMIWTDVIARSVIDGTEIPVGIVTAAIGAPVFMYMMLKKSYGFGGN